MPDNEPGRRPDAPSEEEYRRLAEEARKLREHDPKARASEQRRGMNAAANVWLKYTSVGLQFVLVLLLPLGLGYWADTYFGTLPWLTLVGFALGAAAAMTSIIREVLRMDQTEKKAETAKAETAKEKKDKKS